MNAIPLRGYWVQNLVMWASRWGAPCWISLQRIRPLSLKDIRRIIVERFLPRVHALYAERKIQLEISNEAIDWLAQKGYNERYGARGLERTVERELMRLLALHVPAMLDTLGAIERTFRITVQGDCLAVEG